MLQKNGENLPHDFGFFFKTLEHEVKSFPTSAFELQSS